MQQSQSKRLIGVITSVMLHNPSNTRRFAVTLGVFAVAIIVRDAISGALLADAPYITFFPAIFVVAIWAGSFPAFCLIVTSAIYAWFMYMNNAEGLAPKAASSALFMLIGGTVVAIFYALRQAIISIKISEHEALASAATRDLLFHELKHRVLNNLQMIASTLSVQRRAISDSHAGAIIDAAIARIHTVANVQTHLSDSSQMDINISELLTRALPHAARISQGAFENAVQLSVSGEGPILCHDRALLVAIVATELVSNSVEHGISGNGEVLQIQVTSGTLVGQTGFVEVRDNGAGFPADFEAMAQTSTGLRLAFLFAQQLEGQLTLFSSEGAIARVEFPIGDVTEPAVTAPIYKKLPAYAIAAGRNSRAA